MADIEIRITVVPGGKKDVFSSDDLDDTTYTNAVVDSGVNKKSVKSKSQALLLYSYNRASSIVSNVSTDIIDRYFAVQENYILQDTYRNVNTAVSLASSLVTASISGARLGGVPGAVIGFAFGATNAIYSGIRNESNAYKRVNEENYNVNFTRSRAGLIDLGRGTMN